MVPVDSVRVSRDPTYSGAPLALNRVSCTGLSPSTVKLSSLFYYAINYILRVLQPREGNPLGLGYSRFARRY